MEAIEGRFCLDGTKSEIEPGNIMMWAVNNSTLRRYIENILESVSEVCNVNVEVVSGIDGNNHVGKR